MLTQEQKDRLQLVFKIPVDLFHPRTYWIVSIDEESQMPSDLELRQIISYREFIIRLVYTESYAKKILGLGLPAESGHNTTIFRKGSGDEREQDAWFYRKLTWCQLYAPNIAAKDYKKLTLVKLMDCMREPSKRWRDWKLAHPEIFDIGN